MSDGIPSDSIIDNAVTLAGGLGCVEFVCRRYILKNDLSYCASSSCIIDIGRNRQYSSNIPNQIPDRRYELLISVITARYPNRNFKSFFQPRPRSIYLGALTAASAGCHDVCGTAVIQKDVPVTLTVI
jgi:hypothetical protein